jgi:hypothetical protein
MINVYICCDGVVPLHSPPLKKRQPEMSVHEPGMSKPKKNPKEKSRDQLRIFAISHWEWGM